LSRYSLCHYPLDQLTSINLNNTDDFHTPEELAAKVEKILESFGHSTARNQPFSGTIVPMKHYRKDERVQSMMIEINRWLYLGEDYSVDSERLEIWIEVLRRVGRGA